MADNTPLISSDIQTDLNRLKANQTYFFVDRSFQTSVMENFQHLRREGTLCDVNLRLGRAKLPAHRVVLGVSCPYFKAMFIDCDNGKFVRNADIPTEIDQQTMEMIVDYIYGGKIYINQRNAAAVLKAATILQLESLKEECSYALVKYLTPENCSTTREVALACDLPKLYEASQQFIFQHFVELSQTFQFLKLSDEAMEELLASDRIHVTNEQQVFDSLVRWTEHNRPERGVHFAKLMRHVRLPLMTSNLLVDRVEREELVQRSPVAKEMLMEAMKYNMTTSERRSSLTSPRTIPRACAKLVEVILFIGGKSRSLEESCATLCYEPREDSWYTLAPTRTGLEDHSLAEVDGFVYSCGGSVEGKSSLLYQDYVHRFDTSLNQWDEVALLQEARARLSTVAHEGLLYAVGGMISGPLWNAAEVFNPVSNRWKFIATPNVARLNHAMVAMGTYIYVIGGEGEGIDPVISVERYDPAVDMWSFIPPLSVGKAGSCAVVKDGKIYVMGGSNGYHTLRQCEVYDPETHQWKCFKSLKEFRQNAEAVVLDNCIYVIGGRTLNGEQTLDSIERYDPTEDAWTLVTSIPMGKQGARCITTKVNGDHLLPLKNPSQSSTW